MKKISNFKSIAGFTLIELIMYIGIFSILLLVLVQIFTSILDAQQEGETTSSIYQDGQYILGKLEYDIQKTTSITIPAITGQQSSSLQLVIGGVNYTYSVSGGSLALNNNLGANSLNSFYTTVSNLNFKRIGNQGGKDTVVISFTLTSNARRASGYQTKNFQTTIGLR